MQNYKPKISESQLKLAVSDYLEYGLNQGKWYADRLNSGEIIAVAGNSRRRIKLCREGTADFMVIKARPIARLALADSKEPIGWAHDVIGCRLIFLELKSDKGKQSPEQGAFQKLAEAQGAEYHIIRSLEDLQAVLE